MANILYGVNGEGAGHSTRAGEVIAHLQEKGHTVKVVSFDRGLRNLRDRFDVTEIHGLRFAYVDNRVRYGKTLARNLLTAPQAARSSARLLKLADEWKIDLVITDFEPLAAMSVTGKICPSSPSTTTSCRPVTTTRRWEGYQRRPHRLRRR